MKKITILLLLITITGYSQFSFGPKLGLTASDLKFGKSLESDSEMKYSYAIGGVGEYKVKKFAIGFDLMYNNLGTTKETATIIGNNIFRYDEIYDIKQLTITAMAKYYIFNEVSLGAGLYYGNILSADVENGRTGSSTDYTNNLKRSDIGLAFGLDCIVFKGLFVDARYNLGLTDIGNFGNAFLNSGDFDPFIDGSLDTTIKNKFFSIGIGYRFK